MTTRQTQPTKHGPFHDPGTLTPTSKLLRRAKQWRTVVRAYAQLDAVEGTYSVLIHTQPSEGGVHLTSESYDLDAVEERSALLEITQTLKALGYEGIGRWIPTLGDRSPMRAFKRASA